MMNSYPFRILGVQLAGGLEVNAKVLNAYACTRFQIKAKRSKVDFKKFTRNTKASYVLFVFYCYFTKVSAACTQAMEGAQLRDNEGMKLQAALTGLNPRRLGDEGIANESAKEKEPDQKEKERTEAKTATRTTKYNSRHLLEVGVENYFAEHQKDRKKRNNVLLVIVADQSGSMAGGPWTQVQTALCDILAKATAEVHHVTLEIIVYNDVATILNFDADTFQRFGYLLR